MGDHGGIVNQFQAIQDYHFWAICGPFGHKRRPFWTRTTGRFGWGWGVLVFSQCEDQSVIHSINQSINLSKQQTAILTTTEGTNS